MIKFIKKLLFKLLFTEWFRREEVLELVEEPVIKKPEHCYYHNRFKKSCPMCQLVIK